MRPSRNPAKAVLGDLAGAAKSWAIRDLIFQSVMTRDAFGLGVQTMLQATDINAGRVMRVGVVGVGVMGANHARVLSELPGIELAGVADPDRKQAHAVGSALGCPALGSIEELLDRKVDAITIAAPTHLHRDLALACIDCGVHVLVEKPIAATVAEGEEIIRAARRADVTLMIGHVERFNPAVQAIAQAISGEDILSIAITRVGPFPPRMSNVGVVTD